MLRFLKQKYVAVMVIAGIAVIGIVALTLSRAATPFSSIELESGTVTAPATVINDTTASGGSAVRLGASATSPPAPVSTTLPNQVSRSLFTTTSSGNQVYKHEVRTSTTLSGSRVQAFVYVPAQAYERNTSKIVFGGHGLGEHASNFFDSGAPRNTMLALMDAGYVLVSIELDATCGNQDAMDRLARAGTYIKNIWTPVGSTAMVGFSMGGMTAAVALHRKPIPDMRVAYMVAPPVDFEFHSNPNIWPYTVWYDAYGVNSASAFTAATADFNPLRQPASDYANVRARFATSTEDGDVRNGTLKLINLMRPAAAEVLDIRTSGGHGAASQWESPSTIVNWLNQATAAQ